MTQYNDDIEESDSGRIGFDFRGFLFKVLNLWKFMVVCIGIGLIVAYLINLRQQNVYRLESLISVENDQNPFFTANTSISFNWGGTSGKVGKVMTTVRTRTHNEKVVDYLQYYMDYLVQGKYRLEDIYKKAPFICIEIKDNGIGMAPAELKKIFQKYYRVSQGDLHDVKGYGLGLNYVKRIVHLHKGKVEVESTVNQGSIFTIKIPLA